MVNRFRIVMEESHKSKGKSSVSDSLSSLYSKRRWCLTGTPMGNDVADIAGQFGALGLPVLNDPAYWNCLGRYNRYNCDTSDPGHAGITSILRRTMIRHSKDMRYLGNQSNLLSLPPKVEQIKWIDFNEDEATKYRRVELYNRNQYEFIARSGETNVRKNTIRLLSLIKDLQMVCSGGYMSERLASVLNREHALLDSPPDIVEEMMKKMTMVSLVMVSAVFVYLCMTSQWIHLAATDSALIVFLMSSLLHKESPSAHCAEELCH